MTENVATLAADIRDLVRQYRHERSLAAQLSADLDAAPIRPQLPPIRPASLEYADLDERAEVLARRNEEMWFRTMPINEREQRLKERDALRDPLAYRASVQAKLAACEDNVRSLREQIGRLTELDPEMEEIDASLL